MSRTSAEHTAQYIIEGDLAKLWEALPDEKTTNELHGMTPFATYANAYTALMKRCLKDQQDGIDSRLTRDQLGLIFEYCVGGTPKTPHKLASYLRHQGIIVKRMRMDGLLESGIEIRWCCDKEFLKDVKLRKVA